MTDKSKAQSTLELLETLTSRARKLLTIEPLQTPEAVIVDTDEEAEGQMFTATLTGAARRALRASGKVVEPKPTPADMPAPSYCLAEAEDGEWPVMRSFNSVKLLVERMQALEGRDVVVWAFYGVLLPISAGPERYIMLPGGKAVSVPLFDGAPVKIVDAASLTNVELEPSGYLGPVELRTAMPTIDEAVSATANNN